MPLRKFFMAIEPSELWERMTFMLVWKMVLVILVGILFIAVSVANGAEWVLPSNGTAWNQIQGASVEGSGNLYTARFDYPEQENTYRTVVDSIPAQMVVCAVQTGTVQNGSDPYGDWSFRFILNQGDLHAESTNSISYSDFGSGYFSTSTWVFNPCVVVNDSEPLEYYWEGSGTWDTGLDIAPYTQYGTTTEVGYWLYADAVDGHGSDYDWENYGTYLLWIGSSNATGTTWFEEESENVYTWATTGTEWVSDLQVTISGLVDEIKYKAPWGYAFLIKDAFDESMEQAATSTVSVQYADVMTFNIWDESYASSTPGFVTVAYWIRLLGSVFLWLMFGIWAYNFAMRKAENI